MNNKALKVILSSTAALASALSLSASTFAYVLIGNSVSVEDFQFNIEGQTGLLVSLDGENFSQDITSNMIKEKIGTTVELFDQKKFQGVTPKMEAGKVTYDSEGAMQFQYDFANEANRVHTYKPAEANVDYIAFPLWFKAISTTTATSTFHVVMGEKTKIESIEQNIDIQNTFTVKDANGNDVTYAPASVAAGQNNYRTNVDQRVSNAIRLGLYSYEEENKLRIFEVTDDADLGTTAIEGSTDEHDPARSIMYNYYNAVFPLYPFQTAATPGEAYQTIKQFGSGADTTWTGEYVTKFDADGVAKVMVYLWLEGWDADYLLNTSVEASEIGATLEFALSK